MARFGGIAAFTRGPADDDFQSGAATVRDDIIVLEVMADTLEPSAGSVRRHFERTFAQEEIVIRATSIDRL